MRDEVLFDESLGERIHRRVFPSGLTAYVVRKPEFTRSYATIAVRYGSIDTHLGPRGPRLPDGIAHFLEHKMFEMPDGDAFDLFAARGASANAYTSFSSTRYLFGTSTDFPGNLRTLLDMVFDLHVDEANVEKEKGIIDEEIAGYDDDPMWRLYFGALQAMYAKNPVRIDIAGTKKTIAAITAALLHDVHRTYYHPRNMVLSAVSPEPPGVTWKAIEERVETRRFGRGPGRRPPPPAEPEGVARPRVRRSLPVARPRLLLACKDKAPKGGGKRRLKHELASAIALDCVFGNSGSVFMELFERGLVDDSFSYNYTADRGYSFAMAGGEADDVLKLKRALERALDDSMERGVDEATFQRVRNKVIGDYARAFNSPERIAHLLVGHHMRGTVVSDQRAALFEMTRAGLTRRLRELLAPERRCYSVVSPTKN